MRGRSISLGNVEYTFITITHNSTLALSDSTSYCTVYGLNRNIQTLTEDYCN